MTISPSTLALGLRANWRQFSLLVAVTAFVGAMVGLERTVVPLIAERDFGILSKTVLLSFIVSFGIVKALANLAAGALADRVGRKRLLVAGWLIGLPAPFLIIWAPNWNWIVAANILLGASQGLCWSMTVIMKIDLAGPERRGLAMGLNEFAGYLAFALATIASGNIAATYDLRPYPFYLGIAFAWLGLGLSLLVRETTAYARIEARQAGKATPDGESRQLSFVEVLRRVSWQDRRLFAISQAGLVNNLNDAMVWGLLPIFLANAGLDVGRISLVAAVYPGVWSASQLVTGALSDRWGRKWLIAGGLWVQAAAIALIVLLQGFAGWMAAAALMGLGTAMVYPTLLAAVGDVAHPAWRASAVGVYRLWRDSGYAVGALLTGLLADTLGVPWAIIAVAVVTAFSGLVVSAVLRETRAEPVAAYSLRVDTEG
jgi:MFS family permease